VTPGSRSSADQMLFRSSVPSLSRNCLTSGSTAVRRRGSGSCDAARPRSMQWHSTSVSNLACSAGCRGTDMPFDHPIFLGPSQPAPRSSTSYLLLSGPSRACLLLVFYFTGPGEAATFGAMSGPSPGTTAPTLIPAPGDSSVSTGTPGTGAYPILVVDD